MGRERYGVSWGRALDGGVQRECGVCSWMRLCSGGVGCSAGWGCAAGVCSGGVQGVSVGMVRNSSD